MEEQKIIETCQKVMPEAQRQLYEYYMPYVLTIARRFGILDQDVSDVIQDTFVEVFLHIKRYDATKGAFKYWIKAIAINKILNAQRKEKRSRQMIVIDSEKIETNKGVEDFNYLDNDLLIRLIKSLPDGYRSVFNLYVIDDLSHKEISERLGINVVTSRSQLSRAKQLLRKKLLEMQKGNRDGLA